MTDRPDASPSEPRSNFIRAIIDADRAAAERRGEALKIVTRFPPEPNGYLHIGHAKSICLNFGLAESYGGDCHLRFDDTNPAKEEQEYVDSIQADVAWLGFRWDGDVRFASDYFEWMVERAFELIDKGLAYVDSVSIEELRELRGDFNTPGRPSPYRDRTVADNRDLFERMAKGEFPDGEHVLRAKIDLTHPNMIMRDPPIYRIRHAHHHRQGDRWCIYPMYDFAHCLEDAFEGVTHSICTLEFVPNREFYDWVLDHVTLPAQHPGRPKQIEFARLALEHTVMSKRKFLRLVESGVVSGWDDPRMPTISGLRRRGVRPEAVRKFADMIGVAKANSLVDIGKLEFAIRDDLNHVAPRYMAVLDPLPVTVVNWDDGEVDTLTGPLWPHDVPNEGERELPFGRELVIERSDFALDPPKGWHRLAPGGEVRLRYAYVVKCERAVTDPDTGEVVRLEVSVDRASRGGKPADRRKVKGTIHWASAAHAVAVEARLYDRLFADPVPGTDPEVDVIDEVNPDSLKVVAGALVEPALAAAARQADGELRVQFERNGYFFLDPADSTAEALVFNRTIELRDSWSKKVADSGHLAPAKSPPVRVARAAGEGESRKKRSPVEERRAARAATPALEAHYVAFQDALGLDEPTADVLTAELALSGLFEAAVAAASPASASAVAKWVTNVLLGELKDRAVAELPFGGAEVGELVALLDGDTISTSASKQVLAELLERGGSPKAIVEAKGLAQMSDVGALEAAIAGVLEGHPGEVARFRSGDKRVAGFLMGQVMRATKGKANPGMARKLLEAALQA